MLPAAVQILAFFLALLGVVGVAVAMLLPTWQVSVGGRGGVLPVWRAHGLWMDCSSFSLDVFSCSVKRSPLALPLYLQTARAAMLLSTLLATFGLCLAALGLRCVRWGGGQRAKAHTAMAAGACLVLSALLSLTSAAWFTHQVVTVFLRADPTDSGRFQPGSAVGLTFVSAGFLLAAGVVFCLSCPGNQTRRPECVVSSETTIRTTTGRARKSQTTVTNTRGNYSRQEYV
ncbi:claudin-20-like [Gouania willdenowi]|uniref:Claudin n=1 Tax=Gouania willdenowi TaxID=441366 RepID=A0A8C5EA38_GOUWI|nr:claudin-20-like [Gouania willdenowi]